MSTLVGPTLGSFLNICRAASVLPVCQAFILRGDKTCTLMGVSIATTKITDILDVALCILCALAMIYVAYRTHSKYAAVGRSEMGILNLLYFCMLVVQIPSVGGWMTSQPELTNAFFLWSSIIHTALIATTGWVLLLNGFVGFQLVTDGTPASVYSIAVTAFLVFTGTGYVAADTVYGWTTVFAPGTNLVSLPLFALEFLVPVVAVLVYMLCQVLLVYTQLSVRKPLLWLLFGFAAFALAQVFTFILSDSICTGTGRFVDGKFFNTLLTFVSFLSIHKYWSAITEDEWEDFEDQF